MPWHPPIPLGALYTEDAIKIGPALSLLGYCYDCVTRDGWARLSLRQAAGDMNVSYATVKRWWDLLQRTDYIAEWHDHRRGGIEIRIADHWLDWWREERYEKGSDVSPLPENIVQKSSRNRPEKGSDVSPNHNAYKVLNTSDQTRESEDQDRTRRTLSHPAVAAYYIAFPHIRLNQKQEAIISELVGEGVERLECWQEVIRDYELSTIWKPENIGNMRSRFDRKLLEGRQKKQNKPADERPSLPVYQTPKDRPPAEQSRKKLSDLAKDITL